MRILIVCQHFWPESFRINDICSDMADNGHQVDVLCGIPNYPKGIFFKGYNYFGPRKEKYENATVYRVGEIPQTKKLGKLSIILNFYFFPFASLFHLPALMRRHYDVVFLYSLTPVFMSFPGLLLAKIQKIPSVLYVLDYWPDSLFSLINIKSKIIRRHFARVSKWHYKNATKLLTPSRGMKDKIFRELGIPEDRISFLPQSCEALYEKKEYSRELHERFDDRFNIVFAGNLGPAQALTILADAAAIIKKEESTPCCRFILVGDGMSKASLIQYIEQLGVSEYFVFEGYKTPDTIPQYHELADVLFVSLADNPLYSIMIPSKVQSYMAAGKPILAALSGEGAEIIEQNGCGKACRPGDPDSLAQLIMEYVKMSPEMLSGMGELGFAYYYSNYRFDIVKTQLNNEIEDCVRSFKNRRQRQDV